MMRKCILVLLAIPFVASADPVEVDFTVSGSSGAYLLDFTVTNNLVPGEGIIYFFGVLLSDRNIVSSPGTANPNKWISWDNTNYGGCCVYNNNWINFNIGEGTSLGGFQVLVADPIAPTAAPWFVYASGGSYEGTEPFLHTRGNPGFEGGSVAAEVPEPGTLALLGIGLAGMGLARRRKTA